MNNKRPQLVIVLASLALGVREIVSQHIQRALFDMGYFWSHSDWQKGQPLYLKAATLHICSRMWNPCHITYCANELRVDPNDGPTLVFDAAQVSEFLEAARAGIVEKREIEGVQVIITPDAIQMDASALLKRVSQKANAIQQELWD